MAGYSNFRHYLQKVPFLAPYSSYGLFFITIEKYLDKNYEWLFKHYLDDSFGKNIKKVNTQRLIEEMGKNLIEEYLNQQKGVHNIIDPATYKKNENDPNIIKLKEGLTSRIDSLLKKFISSQKEYIIEGNDIIENPNEEEYKDALSKNYRREQNLLKIKDKDLESKKVNLSEKEKYDRFVLDKHKSLNKNELKDSINKDSRSAVQMILNMKNEQNNFFDKKLDELIKQHVTSYSSKLSLPQVKSDFRGEAMEYISNYVIHFPFIYNQYTKKQLEKCDAESKAYAKNLYNAIDDMLYKYIEQNKFVIVKNENNEEEIKTNAIASFEDFVAYMTTLFTKNPNKIMDVFNSKISENKNKNSFEFPVMSIIKEVLEKTKDPIIDKNLNSVFANRKSLIYTETLPNMFIKIINDNFTGEDSTIDDFHVYLNSSDNTYHFEKINNDKQQTAKSETEDAQEKEEPTTFVPRRIEFNNTGETKQEEPESESETKQLPDEGTKESGILYATPEPSKINDRHPQFRIQQQKDANTYFELQPPEEDKTREFVLSETAIRDILNKKLSWGIALGSYFVFFTYSNNEVENQYANNSEILNLLKNSDVKNIKVSTPGVANLNSENVWVVKQKGTAVVFLDETAKESEPAKPEPKQPESTQPVAQPVAQPAPEVTPEVKKVPVEEYQKLLKEKRLEIIKKFESNPNNIRILAINLKPLYKDVLKTVPNKVDRGNYTGGVFLKNLITLEYDYDAKLYISLFEDGNAYKNEKMKEAFMKEPVMKFNVFSYNSKGKKVSSTPQIPDVIVYLYKDKMLITDIINGKTVEVNLENSK